MTTIADNLKQHGFSPITPPTFGQWVNAGFPGAPRLQALARKTQMINFVCPCGYDWGTFPVSDFDEYDSALLCDACGRAINEHGEVVA